MTEWIKKGIGEIMIRVNMGYVEINGSAAVIMAETNILLRGVKECLIKSLGENAGLESYKKLLEDADKTDEELDKLIDETKEAIIKDIMKHLF
nr:MAG TPA: hypothetical protein [Caudoviricetes sp.]